MKKAYAALSASVLLSLPAVSFADQVYGGVGFPGLTLGYATSLGADVGIRGELATGLNVSRDGQRDGVDFKGNFKATVVSALADYYPMANGLRVTGGLNFNDVKFSLQSTGNNATATINNKNINLNGETFSVEVKYPSATPYLGIGYGTRAAGQKGWGFYADLGLSFGKFKTTVTTSVVGKPGVIPGTTITQADVDRETQKIRDDLNKLSVFPKIAIGVSYNF